MTINKSTGGKRRKVPPFLAGRFWPARLVSLSLRLIHGAAVDFGTANAVNACSRFQFRYPLRFARKSNPPACLIYCNGSTPSGVEPTRCREHSQANVGGQKNSQKSGPRGYRRRFHAELPYLSRAKTAAARRSASLSGSIETAGFSQARISEEASDRQSGRP